MHPHVALFTPPPVPVAQHFTPTSQQRLTPILAVAPATSAVPQSTSHARVAGATAAAAAVKEALRHADLYSTGDACEELSAAVAGLVANNPSPQPGPDSLTQGQGTWEVFHAPHIARLSSALGARFQPIRYTLRGDEIISNVRYQHPLLGTGWLSASGTIEAVDNDTLRLHFTRFWWDLGEESLRPELPPASSTGRGNDNQAFSSNSGGSSSSQAALDAVVGAVGRLSFLPPLARFPVQHLDGPAGLSVFRFPPLASSIAIARVDDSNDSSSSSTERGDMSAEAPAAPAGAPVP
ncbi:hypothetical protein D9Q98_004457 [Chlorella vulgaris]|uniref:Uncharacterized protein n=1 Tax=Chlorella vulgaris TaxID=3077 RepID=A0A9D4YXY4_CHLVU|nr:hypothetical protein D9Q98_004457 [Chlorella vulgaris]